MKIRSCLRILAGLIVAGFATSVKKVYSARALSRTAASEENHVLQDPQTAQANVNIHIGQNAGIHSTMMTDEQYECMLGFLKYCSENGPVSQAFYSDNAALFSIFPDMYNVRRIFGLHSTKKYVIKKEKRSGKSIRRWTCSIFAVFCCSVSIVPELVFTNINSQFCSIAQYFR